eukprot:TRINITY_DN4199_c0_g1_i1.p1 TRINITY_DN4199_c0_g1~~TRINITY_DN4199_c0_g1_i1.p1  ORF type:complete len:489 (-),score=75.73 TRINITY_DN4199_c0_g1_i1:1470-2900(-)
MAANGRTVTFQPGCCPLLAASASEASPTSSAASPTTGGAASPTTSSAASPTTRSAASPTTSSAASPTSGAASPTSKSAGRRRRSYWARLALLYLASVFASGFLPGQALIIPMLAEAGVCSSECPHGYQPGSEPCDAQMVCLMSGFVDLASAFYVFFLPIGFLFDDYGGRAVGTLGALLTTVGYLVVAGTVFGAQLGVDGTTAWLLVPAIILAEFGAAMNSYSLYAMLYHLEGHSAFVISLSNSSTMAAAFLPLIMQCLMKTFDIGLIYALFIMTMVTLASTLVCWIWAPDKQEFHVAAQRALKMPLPKVHNRNTWQKLRDAVRSLSVDRTLHISLCAFTALGYAFVNLYQSMASEYGRALLGKEAGDALASMSALSTGMTGVILGPFGGLLADFFGVPWLAAFAWLCISVPVALCRSASWMLQAIAMAASSTYSTIVLNLIQRHVLHYVPANRLGVAQGAATVVVTILMLLPQGGS